MAFLQPQVFKGISLPATYIRISSVLTTDYINAEGVKKWQAQLTINRYTDSTKEYDIEQTNVTLDELDLQDLMLTVLYDRIRPLFE